MKKIKTVYSNYPVPNDFNFKKIKDIVDDSTTTVYIPTPKGWKCKIKDCHTEVRHSHPKNAFNFSSKDFTNL